MPQSATDPTASAPHRRPPPIAVLLALSVACAYVMSTAGNLNSVDSWPSLAEAAALVETGSVHYREMDPAIYGSELTRAIRALPVNKYGFSLHLLHVPLYWIGAVVAGQLGVPPLQVAKYTFAFANPIAGAVLVGSVFATLSALRFRRTTALTATLAVAIGSWLWPLTGVSYSDPIQAAYVSVALLCVSRHMLSGSVRSLHGFGAAAVAVFLAKPVLIVLLTGFAGRLILRSTHRRRSVISIAAWGVVAALLFAVIQYWRFGSPFATGYERDAAAGRFLGNPAQALFDYTVSFRNGVIWFVPWAPAALWGLWRLRRVEPAAANWLGATLCAYVAVLCVFKVPTSSLGPRYLVPTLPLLAVGLAALLRSLTETRTGAMVARVGLAACVVWMIPMVLVAWYLPTVAMRAVERAGGHPPTEPHALSFVRVLALKFPTGPDRIPLHAFDAGLGATELVWADRDNGGWDVWWLKQTPGVPPAARVVAVVLLATIAGLAALSISRTWASDTGTTRRRQ